MGLPARHLETQVRSEAWLSIVDAARSQGRMSLAVKATPPTAGKPVWHVHRRFDRRLSSNPSTNEREHRARESLLAKGYPAHAVELGYRKAYYLRKWINAGGRSRDAEKIIAEAKRVEGEYIGLRTFQLWRKAYYTLAEDGEIRGVQALIDRRALARSLHPSGPAGGSSVMDDARPSPVGRSQEAIAYFFTVYHSQGKQSVKTCHHATLIG